VEKENTQHEQISLHPELTLDNLRIEVSTLTNKEQQKMYTIRKVRAKKRHKCSVLQQPLHNCGIL